MSDYDRFEYLEIDGATPMQVCPAPATRIMPTERAVSEAPAPTRKLVVDQIIGSHGRDIGEFNCPCGLAVDRQGNLYVCDSYNHRIQKITPNGDATAIGGRGSEPGKFLNPQDIYIDDRSTMYILEQGNCRIQKITYNGRLERIIGQPGGQPGEFDSPMGIAVDRSGNIYVADTGNSRIQKLSPLGLPIFVISSARDRQLCGPQGVELDMQGNFFIADTFSHCIVMFDPNGRETGRFGCRGTGPREFDEPQDLAIDIHGAMYVIEMANNRLQVMDADNSSMACLDLMDSPLGAMKSPTGITISPTGEIYVSDTMNHRILRIVWR